MKIQLKLTFLLFLFGILSFGQEYERSQESKPSKTIMLISGAFVTNEGWGEWISKY